MIRNLFFEKTSVCRSLPEVLTVLNVTEKGEYLPALSAPALISAGPWSPLAVGKDNVAAVSCPYKGCLCALA